MKMLKPVVRMFVYPLKLLAFVNPFKWITRMARMLSNWRKGRYDIDYVMLHVPSTMPTLSVPRNFIQRRILGEPPLSLWELDRTFRRIAEDARIQGVVLYFGGLQMGLADLQTLRDSIHRLRKAGKRVISYSSSYDIATYFLASAGDDIILQPTGQLMTLGLYRQALFMRDALDAIGIQIESVAISPYKGAADQFTLSDISPEGREQLEWLLDSQYQMIIRDIAKDRKITTDEVQAMIDGAPYVDTAAAAAGYVDALLQDEQLPGYLKAENLVDWSIAKMKLLDKPRSRHPKSVALLNLSGMIIDGESRKPPIDIPVPILGGEMMGHRTVVQQVRGLMQTKQAAAVVVAIDSPGGSVTASEAMTSALQELAADRPLVVYMHGVAASGGYYIATPAQWIVAQPGTITGSIGVIIAKLVNSEMLKKLRLNAVDFMRGGNANLMTPNSPLSDVQRQQLRDGVEHAYQQFIEKVAHSREMTIEGVDAVGGGRVWTGAQALEHGLVDELGGIEVALAKARELAALPEDSPIMLVRKPDEPLAPQLAERANPAAALMYLQESLKQLTSGRAHFLLPMVWD